MTEETTQTEAAEEAAPETDLAACCKEMEHRYKLALADYQNLLKQTAKERRDLVLYANEALILEMIPVYDNLKLSLKHVQDADAQWLVGITHVIQQFKKTLEDAGVKEIVTEKRPFDPVSMEAVENRPLSAGATEDVVAEELKGGYMLHEKVIIPARVAVFKN